MGQESKKPRVGISIGDHNGLGPEVIIKSLLDKRVLQDFIPILYGSPQLINQVKKALDIPQFNYTQIDTIEQAKLGKISVLDCWKKEFVLEFGKATQQAGELAFLSLETAVKDLASNKVDVLVTGPINKHTIQSQKFSFPGHTEYLAKYSNTEEVLMLLVSESLRVGVVTGHIPLAKVSAHLTKELILEKLRVMNNSLKRDFQLLRPKIAVLGLNPHAGDGGLLGEEEKKVIIPAIQQAEEEGMLVFGPYAADGFFGSSNFRNFDGIMAMYHDQGLAPFKALSFDQGVNYTAGLPVVRTAPDHGTGYALAGKNTASCSSFRNAIYLACDVFESRKLHRAIASNPLRTQQMQESEQNG